MISTWVIVQIECVYPVATRLSNVIKTGYRYSGEPRRRMSTEERSTGMNTKYD